MGVLIDSSVLIAYERGALDPDRIVARHSEDDPLFLSMITVSELLHGVHRAKEPVRRVRRSVFVEGIIDRFPLLDVDLPTARVHAEVWAELSDAGNLIGAHDLWLGAAAIAHGLTLATHNVREFERIPGLEVEDWSS